MPKSGISLLPQEVEKVRAEEARASFLRRLAVIFFVAAFLVGVVVFGYSFSLRGTISNLDTQISKESSKISSMSETAVQAQDLSRRSSALREIFANRADFSVLLAQIQNAVPPDVKVTDMVVPSEESVSVSGTSRSYPSLAKFLLSLQGGSGKDSLFKTVELRSVSLDKQSGEVKFDVNLKIAEGGLRR
jgi:Tfp pilus assembly protein PilN